MVSAPTLAGNYPPGEPWRKLLLAMLIAAVLFWFSCLCPLGWFPGAGRLR